MVGNKTIVTGTDNSFQHYLPWWVESVKKNFPSADITICDFGMNEKWVNWSKENANEFISYDKGNYLSWFLKPQTLVDSQYEYKCWIDIDCEILKDISDIFNYVKEEKLSTTIDHYHAWGCKFQTGVFAVKGTPAILKEWAAACAHPKNRGDQEILWDVVKEKQHLISLIPENYNWLRIALARGKDHKDKKIIHWTGDSGKEYIEKNCLQMSKLNV